MIQVISRRKMIVVTGTAIAGLAAAGPSWAEAKTARSVYPVALPTYTVQFVAQRMGFFKDEGLDVQLTQAGGGTKMRDIVAAGHGDMGIGDMVHPLQLNNRGRPAKVLNTVDSRNGGVFIVAENLYKAGITDVAKLAAMKRPDGGRPLIGVSSLGGNSHVWSTFFLEQMGFEKSFTFRGLGTTATLMGALKGEQIDGLVLSRSALKDAQTHGWGRLLFDMADDANWDKYIGGKVPSNVNFVLQSTIERDPAMVQAMVNALLRSARWVAEHSPQEILEQIEPFVGSTSRDANLIDIELVKEVIDTDGRIDPASFERGGKVYFREITGIKPVALTTVYAPDFIDKAHAKARK